MNLTVFRFLGVVTTYLELPYTSPLKHKSLLLLNFWNTTWTNTCYQTGKGQ